MTDIVERLREGGCGDYCDALEHEAADEIERLRVERDALKVDLDICRDAIENCYLAVEDCLPTDSDSDAAVNRCTRRRLNEAVGKATPRLMFERAEGQRFYGLHWKELMAERDALRASTALCEKHSPAGGARSQCVICSGEKLQAALSQISYLCEEPNEMGVSAYDVFYDEDAVVEQVRKTLGKSPT